MLEPGSQVQNAIYLAGGAEWPVAPEDWEAAARAKLEQGPFDYVAGGAGSEATVRANRDAFDRVRLRPRMLVGTAERDLSVEVLGLRSPAPFLLAPVGVLSIVHPEAELGVARASRATGVPMILSSAASTSLEDVATELGEARSAGSSSTGGATASSRPAWSTAPAPRATARSSSRSTRSRSAGATATCGTAISRSCRVRGWRSSSATRSSASGSTRRPRRTCRRRR